MQARAAAFAQATGSSTRLNAGKVPAARDTEDSTVQAICGDRGRPARKRADGAQSFASCSEYIFALRAHCGRDARGPGKSRTSYSRLPSAFCLLRFRFLFLPFLFTASAIRPTMNRSHSEIGLEVANGSFPTSTIPS